MQKGKLCSVLNIHSNTCKFKELERTSSLQGLTSQGHKLYNLNWLCHCGSPERDQNTWLSHCGGPKKGQYCTKQAKANWLLKLDLSKVSCPILRHLVRFGINDEKKIFFSLISCSVLKAYHGRILALKNFNCSLANPKINSRSLTSNFEILDA